MDAFGLFRGIAKSFAAFPDYLARTNGEYQLWKAYGTNWKEVERQKENKASMAIEEHQSKMKNEAIGREQNILNARAQVVENMESRAKLDALVKAKIFDDEGRPLTHVTDPRTGERASSHDLLDQAYAKQSRMEIADKYQKRQDELDKEKAKVTAKDLEHERSTAAQEDRQAATRSDIRLRHEMDKKIKKYEFDLDEKERLRKMKVVEYPVGGRDKTQGMSTREKDARLQSTIVEMATADPEKWGLPAGIERPQLIRYDLEDYPVDLIDAAKAKLKVKTPRDKLKDEVDEQAIAAVRIQQLILKGIDREQWDPRDIKWADELAK